MEASRGETRQAQGEAHALAIRMGLYRQTLKSDLGDLVAREEKKARALERGSYVGSTLGKQKSLQPPHKPPLGKRDPPFVPNAEPWRL